MTDVSTQNADYVPIENDVVACFRHGTNPSTHVEHPADPSGCLGPHRQLYWRRSDDPLPLGHIDTTNQQKVNVVASQMDWALSNGLDVSDPYPQSGRQEGEGHDGTCGDPDCTQHDHYALDERWCAPHGRWAIGNPCPQSGSSTPDD